MEPKHGGCIICSGGDDEILTSKTISGSSVALCKTHVNATEADLPKKKGKK